MRLLLVEDDFLIGRGVNQTLRDQGYAVDWVRDGLAARAQIASRVHDLAILDLGLPHLDGLAVLREARLQQQELPILVLTARESPSDRVRGLDAGADDYLIKPFDLDELAARIRALLRRRVGRADPIIQHRGITINPSTQQVRFKGELVALQPREYFLLVALLERPGAVLSRDQLRGKLYRWGDDVESNTIDVHVHSLRKKISADSIRTVRGVGYCTPEDP
jgi:two-component system, OmpR family, response regulator QseB